VCGNSARGERAGREGGEGCGRPESVVTSGSVLKHFRQIKPPLPPTPFPLDRQTRKARVANPSIPSQKAVLELLGHASPCTARPNIPGTVACEMAKVYRPGEVSLGESEGRGASMDDDVGGRTTPLGSRPQEGRAD
jgi:hypothetical protein